MSYKCVNTGERAMCHLLRIHLWGEAPDEALIGSMTADDWAVCYTQSCRQGIRALVFAAIKTLAPQLCPPDTIMARLEKESGELASLNRNRREALSSLCDKCRSEGLDPVLLKGFGIASLYPVPDYRECGDVDLWFPGKAEQADEVLRRLGTMVAPPDTMHSKFLYGCIRIENHHTFLRTDKPGYNVLAPVLQKIWDREGARRCGLSLGVDVTVPGPVFQLLHNARHIVSHLTEKFTLRNIIDWMLLLRNCPDGREDMMNALSGAGFAPALSMVGTLAEDCLGMHSESALFPRDDRFSEKLLEHMLHPVPERVFDNGILKYLSARWTHFNDRFWMYKLIYGITYQDYVTLTIKKKMQERKTIGI